MRSHAVTALLIKRHTLATLFVGVASLHFTTPEDPAYATFLAEYQEWIDRFEEEIVPYLEPTDVL